MGRRYLPFGISQRANLNHWTLFFLVFFRISDDGQSPKSPLNSDWINGFEKLLIFSKKLLFKTWSLGLARHNLRLVTSIDHNFNVATLGYLILYAPTFPGGFLTRGPTVYSSVCLYWHVWADIHYRPWRCFTAMPIKFFVEEHKDVFFKM
jgi:hypothetical protein